MCQYFLKRGSIFNVKIQFGAYGASGCDRNLLSFSSGLREKHVVVNNERDIEWSENGQNGTLAFTTQ